MPAEAVVGLCRGSARRRGRSRVRSCPARTVNAASKSCCTPGRRTPALVEPQRADRGVRHLRIGRGLVERIQLGDADAAGQRELRRDRELHERRDRHAVAIERRDSRSTRQAPPASGRATSGRTWTTRRRRRGVRCRASSIRSAAEARVLLDQIVADVEREVRQDQEVVAAHRERQLGAPALIRVIEGVRLHRLEAQPSRLLRSASGGRPP